ncbi:MAG: glycosyltransferase family 4 protein [Actinobacteria bacterium]|nr:MAG: glycosyltransferase family 4 protein [Actinomycetota bacterium]
MRVLVVTNITPDPVAPSRGVFVRDQVAALRRAGIEVELLSFPGGRWNYPRAVPQIRRLLRGERFDLVHAHYGLAGWCASLAGARPLIVTFHGTDVRHPTVGRLSRRLVPRLDLVAGASRALFASESGRPGLPKRPGATAVLPCGADLDRFRPSPRAEARERLGLDPEGRYLLFPAATPRPEKRYDRAAEVGRLANAKVLTAGAIEAEQMPDWVNAASAVLITSENEGFGLAAVEALACNVPVLSTQVGVAPALLHGIQGCLAEPFGADRWAALARRHLDSPDARVAGRERARWFSAEPMAERVVVAYQRVLGFAADP